MKKVSKLVLMLCFVLSAALSYAHGATRTENKKGEGITIEVKEKTCHGGLDKSNAIFASINGHLLTVVFTENLGQVAVEAMYADFEKRSVGLSGSDFVEAFPEGVRTDPQNRLCINYSSVVTMLVEAVKEQQREIEELRSTLEENGLMKKQR